MIQEKWNDSKLSIYGELFKSFNADTNRKIDLIASLMACEFVFERLGRPFSLIIRIENRFLQLDGQNGNWEVAFQTEMTESSEEDNKKFFQNYESAFQFYHFIQYDTEPIVDSTSSLVIGKIIWNKMVEFFYQLVCSEDNMVGYIFLNASRRCIAHHIKYPDSYSILFPSKTNLMVQKTTSLSSNKEVVH